MKVKLLKADKNKNLSTNTTYEVIGIEANDFRILDNDNEPYLYSPKLFKILNKKKPEFWVNEHGEDGERYSYPKEIKNPGFFEDYFDDKKQAKLKFTKILEKYYPETFKRFTEIKTVYEYFKKYHPNLFRKNPFYQFRLGKICEKTIYIELTFKKGQIYCCIEPHCHVFNIKWDNFKIDRIKYFKINFICEKDSFTQIGNNDYKNVFQTYSVMYLKN